MDKDNFISLELIENLYSEDTSSLLKEEFDYHFEVRLKHLNYNPKDHKLYMKNVLH